MGSWLAGLLERNGHRVMRAGRRTRIRPEDAASFCDVVVISVPLGSAIRVIEQVAPMVREDALLMDLTSVKEAPLKAMLQHSRSRVVGLHPLFGPAPDPDEGPLTVAACKGRGESEFQWIRSLLLGEGYRVKEVDPAAHDRLMAVIQGANHFSTMALALFLSRCGISPEELDAWSTPAFRGALGRIRALTSQPGELFQGLLTENPAVADRVTQYREAVETLSRALYSPRGEAFGEIFGRLAGAFGNGGGPFSRSLSSQGGTGPSDTGERKGERHA
jgi:prephenate dehydrogenase